MLVWDRWAGSYGGFNVARRIDLLALADRPEDVARFHIRCVFTMFAEDVHLLPEASFGQLLEGVLTRGPGAFAQAAEALWRAMDTGGLFGWHSILRFNGHFFRESDGAAVQGVAELGESRPAPAAAPPSADAAPAPWPAEAVERIAALKGLATARCGSGDPGVRLTSGFPPSRG